MRSLSLLARSPTALGLSVLDARIALVDTVEKIAVGILVAALIALFYLNSGGRTHFG
jgi:hypothetical protein